MSAQPRALRAAALMTAAALTYGALAGHADAATRTVKPPLHAKQWLAITGKPLGATAGAMIFQQGGNAVDAACAMMAATATMWDVLHWGGETQALIYNPHTGKVIGVNGLGIAPAGATVDFYRDQGLRYPPQYGPQSAVTPGTPGGLLLMLAEYGRLSLAQVLAPAIDLADGYPIEQETVSLIERHQERLNQWPDSRRVMLPRDGKAPQAGQIFSQPELAATLRKLVEAEQAALAAGADRKAAIMAAFDRFYRGDIADEIARATREAGGLITKEDLAGWRPKLEEPVSVSYKGIEVYKLTTWTQGPAMLQALNVLENFDLKAMGYNSPRYIHTLYQAMSLAFADRDFYYGDPAFPPQEPVTGLLSKDYARERAKLVGFEKNDPAIGPGDPYPFQGGENPFKRELAGWAATANVKESEDIRPSFQPATGTTSVISADREGWVVSITPSGGWIPAFIAGNTGIGLSQRMQSFVLDPAENPYNVLEPGKQPRVTLTPTMALRDGKPFLAFAVQGGDSQDQNLLQLFLNMVEFDMTVQQATEATNINSFQMRDSFDQHEIQPGRMLVAESTPPEVRTELEKMGYTLVTRPITSGPLNAIWFDWAHGTMWGGSSHHGEDYGIGW
ncbi:MAG: gamma-glutamyltransferase [Steroidobacteraceae bacterium]|jgi:gamma-glutamyltranspeptidase/glutathione hydrolase|nr:gamma-glutamyltransferase [Steroidobacteraceae bacterium]